jgi:L-lactate dehydrogenase complex protein LldF
MLTEECEMNPYLEKHGIEVVETDLGERIIQLKGQKPSHIVMPAIHLNHDDVGELFEKKLNTEPGNHDPTYLTYMARLSLRNEFLTADAGMTGANFGVAETGDIVVCTNEGNADMSTSCPKLHIAAIGLEKVIPNYDCLAVFQRMLCRAGTGQPTTTYTSHFRKARPTAQQMHIVLVDNGRSEWIADPEHWEVLKCIRCGSCMNTCPVYRRSGGYSYSYFIPGPIGINLGMLRNKQLHSGNVSACTLCLSCQTVCPVKVNLGDQVYQWRQHLDEYGTANKEKKLMCKAMSFLYGSTGIYNTALKFAPIANYVPSFIMECGLNPWAKGHKMMTFPKKSFHDMFKSGMIK